MTRIDSLNYPPRGLNRDEAARYVGVGATKFDEMVADGRMPRPKRVDGRVIWDRLRIEAAFSDLPEDNKANPLDRSWAITDDRGPNAHPHDGSASGGIESPDYFEETGLPVVVSLEFSKNERTNYRRNSAQCPFPLSHIKLDGPPSELCSPMPFPVATYKVQRCIRLILMRNKLAIVPAFDLFLHGHTFPMAQNDIARDLTNCGEPGPSGPEDDSKCLLNQKYNMPFFPQRK
jgi:predicted DNA-binding transcriptional regulator AlpA